ncbi:methyl-accepting chemotaxis sensory transducer [Zymomonas mobilis subsp. mobilis ZM4 = ATCC 31821]|uniref:Methyl-accepting chemotaxis sensory transducer n=1 Tax=Zymomonas mobilis subsp. mobilis (strain ATCC 31821 / ZM4 / CP4) TaxID=264203 RepID=Q5NR28_ZYMMO|nr:methyl-accepting chemotaxis protein [Zymomonas mobilis]AAV88826.1 methyl-accepting chemotaxis sensory transducer [Zymomonas mobilis subsp. mobilis ZM4 = ATCC 31821]AVZ25213.1 methyl-accepting chemotaxis sensory transducer [Zymomonas mobilis subsp. mobilis]AVZ27104.1 methyl-accepting chemotaxis sensory transducer [Zymomonas mobilis subsp. mobilis]AVZ41550.1 methyl-accepting chemotaxis sensory transducer [Zymomonas mobilis subsp. mobilis ZM4 = ATCC 31821]UBQ08034.1 methyl-accepting chemotaxis
MGISNLIKNLKVSTKTYLIMVLPILLLIVGGFGSLRVQWKFASIAKDLGVAQRARAQSVSDISRATADYRSAETRYVMVPDPQAIQAARQEMTVYRGRIEDNIHALEQSEASQDVFDATRRFLANWQNYVSVNKATLDAIQQGRMNEGRDFFWKELPAFDQVTSALGTLQNVEKQANANKVADMERSYNYVRILTIIVTILAVLISLLIANIVIKAIVQPLGIITNALGELAEGNMDVQVALDPREDEIGTLLDALKIFRDRMRNAEKQKQMELDSLFSGIAEALEGLRNYDLTTRIRGNLSGSFSEIQENFNNSLSVLEQTMSQIIKSAENIQNGASEIRQASDDLSQRTEQQAASLEQTSAAMEEISRTVDQAAVGAKESRQITDKVRGEAEKSGDIVHRAMDAMAKIESSSNEIAQIISVIDGIAFQTNLLALNAGVEAARAGDAGKGFAVVASEVRALAQRSAEAAKDVKEKITASAGEVDSGVVLVNEAGQALERIVSQIREVGQKVTEASTMAEEQAVGLKQVNTAVSEMDGVTQQNAAMVEESTAAARNLANETIAMMEQVSMFKLGNGNTRQFASTPAVTSAPKKPAARPASRSTAKSAPAKAAAKPNPAPKPMADDDWSEF